VTFQVWKTQGVCGPRPLTDAVALIAPRPLLLIAGAQSSFEQALQRKLHAAAGETSSLWEIPEAGHTGAWEARPQEYEERMISLFDRALLGK
jgi:pimeloyl-ACP methyl ester carboxylesterase